MAPKKFVVKYTSSAFEQDANQAMKGNVVRGLIELITNCDDAYARAKKTGKIEIIVRRTLKNGEPTQITVRDCATGLDPKSMEENFGVLGGDKSGFAEGDSLVVVRKTLRGSEKLFLNQ
jgi:sensor histidine kinase regulating citrate/malate metabolism